jgi:hypothetical protein
VSRTFDRLRFAGDFQSYWNTKQDALGAAAFL